MATQEQIDNMLCIHNLPAMADCQDCNTIVDAEVFTCGIYGHKFADDGSYANTESAAENFVCEYCYWGFHHIFY